LRLLSRPVVTTLIVASLALQGCGREGRPASSPERLPGGSRTRQSGLASWYGPKFHGRQTASGERYNMFDLTAAHRDLPFGSRLRVTNIENGRQVLVTVNDRGPFVKGRIIDLSYAAAKELGMTGDGVVRVRLEVLSRGSG
jgi:rare lipoprotein A